MTNNKQQTLIEIFLNEIGEYTDTSEIPDELIEKFIKLERANIELILIYGGNKWQTIK